MRYKTENGNCPYDNYIEELAKSPNNLLRIAKIELFIKMLEKYGFEINVRFKKDSVKLVDKNNKIYELRPDNTRIFYFFMDSNQEYVLLHAFTKKTQKAPDEIKKAIKEKKDYIRRNKQC